MAMVVRRREGMYLKLDSQLVTMVLGSGDTASSHRPDMLEGRTEASGKQIIICLSDLSLPSTLWQVILEI